MKNCNMEASYYDKARQGYKLIATNHCKKPRQALCLLLVLEYFEKTSMQRKRRKNLDLRSFKAMCTIVTEGSQTLQQFTDPEQKNRWRNW